MLPLHGQGTAAVECITGQDVPYIMFHKAMFLINSRSWNLPSSFLRVWFLNWVVVEDKLVCFKGIVG